MNQIWLIRKSGNGIAHKWDANKSDTYCRMYTTGGLSKNKYKVSESKGDGKTCQNCTRNEEQGPSVGEVEQTRFIEVSERHYYLIKNIVENLK